MGLFLMCETEVEIGVQCFHSKVQWTSFGTLRWVPVPQARPEFAWSGV